ncbi:hypothetical protein EV385_2792 [Krasilnikovia cinnamomea]|uniref:Uncharacterized protein n=1 Tax=Krasilnikovia cinnamomea TaxID=349313 RepID=A0A4Q7ZJD1_9ACTN|nr:hypothetical protein [Krasilnikovia cinnamomea]RZU50997.1 hypothetical protein EV385_2792 [Krasilnikovia cinnamomea]
MPPRPRPLLAVRLIGPADIVTIHKAQLVAQLTAAYGHRATCRTSTHPASHAGETRVYLTLTPKEEAH